MKIKTGNLFSVKPDMANQVQELFEQLFHGRKFRMERIVSAGHVTPEDQWYNQDQDEWVVLLQGKAELQFDDANSVKLTAGDYVLIPAHKQHRVTYTSSEPPCIWLAIHGEISLYNTD